jgi:hypothetical protein
MAVHSALGLRKKNASAGTTRTRSGKAGTPKVDQRLKRRLLDDLMGDAEECLAAKSKEERKAVVSAIRKVVNS